MSYETETTMLISLADKNKNVLNKIIPLADKLTFIVDFEKNQGQIIMKNKLLFEDEDLKDKVFCTISLTNDPYCAYAGSLTNLGYYRFIWRLCYGEFKYKSPLVFVTNDLSGSIFSENIPLRNPTIYEGEKGFDFIKYKKNSYQVIEYNFKNIPNIEVKYSILDTETNIGNTVVKIVNPMSAYNKAIILDKINHKSKKEILDFYKLKE